VPFEGTAADTAGVLCNTRDEFIRETRRQCNWGVDLIKTAASTWGDVQTAADDEIAAVVDEAHRHNVKVTIHSRGSTSTRAAAKAGVDLIYHADLATRRHHRQGRDAARASVDLALDRGRARRCRQRFG
jgi:imidazolonepropionase-like amidohydrolase